MSATAAAVPPTEAPLSEGARILNTFIAPSKTFTDLRRNNNWWAPWILISIFGLLFMFVVQKQISFEQVSRNQIAHSSRADQFDKLPPDQQARQLSISVNITKYISYSLPVFNLLVWAIMLVSSQLVRTDRHVRPDLVLNIASPRLKRWMEVFNSLAGLVFCVGLTWYGWQVAVTALTIDEHSATDLGFPMWIYDAALPAGGFLMSIRYIIRLAMLLVSSSWKAMLARRPGDNELPATG